MSAGTKTPIVFSDEHHEVKIYTVKCRGGFIYQLSSYRAGQRQRRTFADLDEAKRMARLQLSQLAGERLGAKALSATEMEGYALAARQIEPTGMPLHVCAELFAEAHRVLQGHSILPDTARVALECGNSPNIIFQHYRELVTPDQAQEWFNIFPPADYPECLISRRNKHGRRNWRKI